MRFRKSAVYHVGVVEALGLQVVHEGYPVIAMKKGVNFLDQKSQVHATGRVEELLDFTRPPARRKRAAPVRLGRTLRTVEDFTEFEQRAAYFNSMSQPQVVSDWREPRRCCFT
jgi:hypothetical protein